MAVVWSVQEQRAPSLLALDNAAFEAQLEAASHQALGKLTLASERAAWPLQLARADRWCGPGWVLAGDAAHTVHPLAGQGLNLGLADAQGAGAGAARARILARRGRSEGCCAVTSASRKADVLAMAGATDGLQQLFRAAGRTLGHVAQLGHDRVRSQRAAEGLGGAPGDGAPLKLEVMEQQ